MIRDENPDQVRFLKGSNDCLMHCGLAVDVGHVFHDTNHERHFIVTAVDRETGSVSLTRLSNEDDGAIKVNGDNFDTDHFTINVSWPEEGGRFVSMEGGSDMMVFR